MRTVLIAGLLGGLLASCSADWPQTTASRSQAAHGSAKADDAPASHGPGAIAGFPDRGSLNSYRTHLSVRKGASVWHDVQLSEEHALRAIATGTMVVDAPDGKPIRLEYERHVEHPDGNWTWIGHPVGANPNARAIVTFGEKAVFGSIPNGNEEPLQLTIAAGHTWMVQTDRNKLADPGKIQRESDFVAQPALTPAMGNSSTGHLPAMHAAGSIAALSAVTTPSEAATPSNTVDVVLGYSTEFATRLGGQSQAVTRLNYLVDLANQAYLDSQVNGRIRLLHTLQVNYADTTSNQSALFELTGVSCVPDNAGAHRLPDQGETCTNVGQPAALRPLVAAGAQYGADLVALVRTFQSPENGSCGVAWLLGAGQTAINSASAAYGFSIVSDTNGNQFPDEGTTCREEYLAHELGHNMGLQHNRETARGADDTNSDGNLLDPEEYGVLPYSFGYSADEASGNFYTIMALRRTGATGYRVFSNPRITICGGFACGVTDQADDSRALAQTMPIVAAFRTPPEYPSWYRGDFDGDGMSDILWRNRMTGQNVIWRSANSATTQAVTTVRSLDWMIVGAADFDGDGKSDILWRHSVTGANAIWKSGNSATTQPMATVANQAWVIVGAGDFDGDGKADVLWRNRSTGQNAIWRSANVATPHPVSAVANQAWSVAGVGDFNGDGKDDILWRNSTTGQNAIWLSANSATQTLSSATLGWKVVAVGDFDGDAKADIFWRHTNGTNAIWRSGNPATPQAATAVAPQGWTVIGAGDFNGDNRADILWRNMANGANVVWRSANSATPQAVTAVTNLTWVISG